MNYCIQEVPGWSKLPPLLPDEDQCTFICVEYGMHFLTSIKNYGALQYIHVSIASVRSLRLDLTEQQHLDLIFDATVEAIEKFFPKRQFARMPEDIKRPQVKHYFSVL